MKFKVLIIILILFCYPLLSQEKYQGLRVTTWEQIHGLDYTILSDDGIVIIIIVNGETVIIKNQ